MTALDQSESLWKWLALAILIHLAVVMAWYDVPTENAAREGAPKRMTIRMAVARAIAPAPPKEQPPVPMPPKRQRHKIPTPSPIAPAPEMPAEVTQPVVEDTPAAEFAAIDADALRAEQLATTLESEKASYVDTVRAQIEARKRYPSMARKRALEGVVLARFHIDENGSVVELSTDSTAASILNRSARDAVERAAPFPPPPHGAIVIEVPIRYDLDN